MRRQLLWIALGGVFSLIVTAWLFQNILACPGDCFVDYGAYHGARLGSIETQDARLNSWIIAWVQRALVHEPRALFDGNTFYPARNALAGSEHLIGMALQTWPFAPLARSAVDVHQIGLMLSTVLMGWTTFVLTFALVRVPLPAFVAALAAILMPWRWMEFSHIQLLSAHWFPLIWLLFGRALSGALSGRGVALLALVVGLQVLTSFYLAYFLTFSLAVLAITFIAMRRTTWRGVRSVTLGCGIPYGVFVLSAVPYLLRESNDGLAQTAAVLQSTPWDALWPALLPESLLSLTGTPRTVVNYSIPIVVFLLAPIAPLLSRSSNPTVDRREILSFAVALLAIAVGCALLCFGWKAMIGGTLVTMPGGWAARWVPGYENLRFPIRWAIVIGVALPPLAGIALAGLTDVLARAVGQRMSLLAPTITALVIYAVPNGVPVKIPAAEAWTENEREPYERIAQLPAGSVLSLPWNAPHADISGWESRYALLSTLHWKRTLNGFTAYRPRAYRFLQELAQGVPHPERIEHLVRFADLRWIVRHSRPFDPDASRWASRVEDGTLRVVNEATNTTIYEVANRDSAGMWLADLRDETSAPRTITGLSRESLGANSAGTLRVGTLGSYLFWGDFGLPFRASLTVTNNSAVGWPGLDPDTSGLVQLRATFRDAATGRETLTQLSPLYVDVPPGERVASQAYLVGPARRGPHQVDFDLVQVIEDEIVPMDVHTVTLSMSARPVGAMGGKPASPAKPAKPATGATGTR